MQLLEINYKSVFETLPGYHVLLSPDSSSFLIMDISEACLAAFSVDREKIVGIGFLDSGIFQRIGGDQTTKALFDSFQHVVILKESHSIDCPGKISAGGIVRFSSSPILSHEGDLQHIMLTITETPYSSAGHYPNHGMDVAALSNDNRFQSMLLQSPVAMGILIGKDMVLEIANQPMLELWGKGPEIIGLPIVKGLPEIANQPFPDLLRNVFETGIEFHGVETQPM
jgi:hypothetical protein